MRTILSSTERAQSAEWLKEPISMRYQTHEKAAPQLRAVDKTFVGTTFSVFPETVGEPLLGFGTSVDESSVYNLRQLKPEKQDELIRFLVDPENGMGLTLFRVCIGSPDFTGRDFYTYYDEKPEGTPDWTNQTGNGFSIQKDIDYHIIETIHALQSVAQEFGVTLNFVASCWSPPGWMKEKTVTSARYADNPLGLKGGRLRDEAVPLLAKYYARFLEEYAKLSIPIYAITMQNEPLFEPNYPGCHITGKQAGALAVALQREISESDILQKAHEKTQVWVYDHNCDQLASYLEEFAAVDGALEAANGIAVHDYCGDLSEMDTVSKRYGKPCYLTERSVWGASGGKRIIHYLRFGARCYLSWVWMLDSNRAKHQWPGVPDVTTFVRRAGSDSEYWPCPEAFLNAQFARYIRPGARMLRSEEDASDKLSFIVFQDAEGDNCTAIIVNSTGQTQPFRVVLGEKQFSDTIDSYCIATYLFSKEEL